MKLILALTFAACAAAQRGRSRRPRAGQDTWIYPSAGPAYAPAAPPPAPAAAAPDPKPNMQEDYIKWRDDSYLWAVAEDYSWQGASPMFVGSQAMVQNNGDVIGSLLEKQSLNIKKNTHERDLERLIRKSTGTRADRQAIRQMEAYVEAHRVNEIAASLRAMQNPSQHPFFDATAATGSASLIGPGYFDYLGFSADVESARIGLEMMPEDAEEKDRHVAELFLSGAEGLRDQGLFGIISGQSTLSNIRYMSALNDFTEATEIILEGAEEHYMQSPKSYTDELELRIAESSYKGATEERKLAIARLVNFAGMPPALIGDFAGMAWGRKAQLSARTENLKAELATIQFQETHGISPMDLYAQEVDMGRAKDHGTGGSRRRGNNGGSRRGRGMQRRRRMPMQQTMRQMPIQQMQQMRMMPMQQQMPMQQMPMQRGMRRFP